MFYITYFFKNKKIWKTKNFWKFPKKDSKKSSNFFFIPIPAGVLLYLVVSNIVQIIQTVIINKQLETADKNVIDVKPEK